jgi:iron complex outermembrane receptor protein
MKAFITILILTLYTTTFFAQSQMLGTITDAKTQQPIDATIYIPSIEKGTQTDFDGHYLLADIPEGTFKIIVSALGYKTQTQEVTFLKNQAVTKDFQLIESALEMEEVIISTPFHKLQRDNVMKVARINMEDIKSSGAVTLAQGLNNIAGVTGISTGVGISKPVIRGLSSNRVLTYAQGVRLENQQFGEEHGLGLSDAGVASVEVIKGPASLLYGSDALGGVLYVNPEKFAPTDSLQIDAGSTYFSNTLGTNTTIGIKKSFGKVKFLVRSNYATHSDYKTGESTRVTNSRFNENDFKFGFQYQNNLIKTTLRYNYNRSNLGLPEEIGNQSTSKKLELPFQKIDNQILSVNSTVYLPNSSIDIKAGYLYNNRSEFAENIYNPALLLKLNTFTYDAKYNFKKMGGFETIAGIQGMYQTNKNFGEEFLIPNATKQDFGIMATTHYHLDKVDLQAGGRLDTRKINTEAFGSVATNNFVAPIHKNFTSFNGALGAKFDLFKKITTRLNLASGFRAPNLAELASHGVHEGTNRYEIGNSDLKNEQSFQTDLALEYKQSHFDIFINGFYNHIANYIFISPTNQVIENNQVYIYTQNNAGLYGGEFGFHLHPHPIDWLHFETSFETVTGKQNGGNYLPLIPANTLKNTVRIALQNKKETLSISSFITLKNIFDQTHVSAFETPTKGYTLLNAGISCTKHFKKTIVEATLSGTNLTDKIYISHLSRLKNDGIPDMGRNLSFSLKVSL